jgi:PTH1 family peptidyl-tRNA hydrolase
MLFPWLVRESSLSGKGQAGLKLIVGLGNPGLRYRSTRHNVGFLALERLAKKNRFLFKPNRSFKAFIADGKIHGHPVWLAQPQTFMNLSGQAVLALVKRKKAASSDLLIVCDDVALPLGAVKIKAKGSAGGHKGLASIIERLGTKDFSRLRLGIGKDVINKDLSDYVLSTFKKDEIAVLDKVLDEAVAIMEAWIAEGTDSCMSLYNRKQN